MGPRHYLSRLCRRVFWHLQSPIAHLILTYRKLIGAYDYHIYCLRYDGPRNLAINGQETKAIFQTPRWCTKSCLQLDSF